MNMKKSIIIMLLAVISNLALAENVEITVDGLNYSCDIQAKTATVTYGEYSSLKAVTIKETVTADDIECSVTGIGSYVFSGCDKISSVSFPATLKIISDGAFYDCWRIKALQLPEALEEIGNTAFYKSSIKEIILPEGLKKLGERAFSYCNSLRKVVLPSTLSIMGNMAFYDTKLTLVVSRIVEPFEIDDTMFGYDKPKAVLCVPIGTKQKYISTNHWDRFSCIIEGEDVGETTVDDLDYYYGIGSNKALLRAGLYSEMKNVTIPSSISIGDVKYTVVEIEPRAFYGGVLEEVEIPEGIQSIGEYAFYGNPLKKVVLPSTLKEVGIGVFYDCYDLSILVSHMEKPLEISDLDFFFVNSYTDAEGKERAYGYEGYFPGPVLFVPEGSSSAYKAAEYWNYLQIILEGEPFTVTVDGFNYLCATVSKEAMVMKGEYSEMEEYVIPQTITIEDSEYTVKYIGEGAFKQQIYYKPVTLPETIEIICNDAFNWCSLPEYFHFPKNLKIIGCNAFSECGTLEEIDLPEGLETLGLGAFSICTPRIMRLPSTLKRIRGDMALGHPEIIVSKMEQPCQWINPDIDYLRLPVSSKLYVPKGSKQKYAEADRWNLITTVLEGDVGFSKVGDLNYFWETGNNTALVTTGEYWELEKVSIPAVVKINDISFAVTEIDRQAFEKCTALTSVVFPSTIKVIRERAFEDCRSLASFELPYGLEEIKNYAFASCPSITELNIPSSVKKIGDLAFAGAGITRLVIPEGVSIIGQNAFSSCWYLEQVELPSTLKEIERAAFMECSLKRVDSHIKYPFPIDDDVFRMRDMNFTNAELHVPMGTKEEYENIYSWSEFKTIIDDLPEELGDVNEDYMVDVNDLMLTFRYIYGDTSIKVKENDDDTDYDFNFHEADMNGDGKVDIADVIMVVNAIMIK